MNPKKKFLRLTALVLCLLFLTGCGVEETPDTSQQTQSSVEEDMVFVPGIQTAVCRLADGSMDWFLDCQYDENGNLIRATVSGSDGNLEQEAEFTYDRRGNILTLKEQDALDTIYYSYSAHGKRLSMEQGLTKKKYTYDARGNLFMEERFSSGILAGHFTYSYDSRDNVQKCQEYDSEGNETSSIHYTYDTEGNLLVERQYASTGTAPKTIQYIYDADGNCIGCGEFMQSGALKRYREFSYDAQGNCLSVLCYDGKMQVQWWIEYHYENIPVRQSNLTAFYENRQELFGF